MSRRIALDWRPARVNPLTGFGDPKRDFAPRVGFAGDVMGTSNGRSAAVRYLYDRIFDTSGLNGAGTLRSMRCVISSAAGSGDARCLPNPCIHRRWVHTPPIGPLTPRRGRVFLRAQPWTSTCTIPPPENYYLGGWNGKFFGGLLLEARNTGSMGPSPAHA